MFNRPSGQAGSSSIFEKAAAEPSNPMLSQQPSAGLSMLSKNEAPKAEEKPALSGFGTQ